MNCQKRAQVGRFLRRLSAIIAIASIALPVLASDAIAPENASLLTESTRLDIGLRAFKVSYLTDTRICVSNTTHGIIWNLSMEALDQEISPSVVGRVIGVSPLRDLLAIYTLDHVLHVWSVTPLTLVSELHVLEETDWPRATFSTDQRLLAVVNSWNNVEVWDWEQQEHLHTLSGHTSNLFSLAFSPDGTLLASASGSSGGTPEDACVMIWNVTSGDLIRTLPTPEMGDNHAITFTVDGSRLISTGNRRLLIWDTSTWARTYDTGDGGYPGSYGISLSPDGRLLAVATDSEQIFVIELSSMRLLKMVSPRIAPLDVDFSPDGTQLAATCADHTVRILRIP